MDRTTFAIMGGGFRTQAFLRVARELPHLFSVSGMVVRNPDKGFAIEQAWGVRTYRTLDALLDETTSDFVVLSVNRDASPSCLLELADREIPVLAETPPAPTLDKLRELYRLTRQHSKIQVAEQYQFHPMHAARLHVVNSGILGKITEASVSVSHGYHGVSLLRKFLGVGFQAAKIRAMRFTSPIVAGPTRSGPPSSESVITVERDVAWIEFDDKLGIYDFTKDQHRSWIRSSHVSIRGTRGEIHDSHVNALLDYTTPQYMEMKRINRGEEENLEGYFTKGIMLGEHWVYRNPFTPGRLNDDEIAVATCLSNMGAYVRGGPSFYDLKEASQDHYLALLIERSIQAGEQVISEPQPWAEV